MKVPVIVTTRHRGVFFGYIDEDADMTSETVEVNRLRNCVYWSTDERGFVGLATTGPSSFCKVGPPSPGWAVLRDVTSVILTTPEAAEAWEKGPWAQ